MFKKFRYQRALDLALRDLGIETTELSPAFRDEVLAMGMSEHLTPQETALSVLSVVYPRLGLVDRLSTLQVVRKWRKGPQVSETNYWRTQNGALALARSPAFREK